ncbi:MAG TPA: DUF4384 domain-containing protein, partial [Pyrinomonadaceae bacterium]|nr:DUF4384 domain-containing protein [Pyrinomonadaceae bacterium]
GDRYQTARDLLIDLKNLRRRLEIDAELERSSTPLPAATDEGSKSNASLPGAIAKTTTASAPSPFSRKMLLTAFIGAAVLLGLLIIGSNVWRASRSSSLQHAPAAVPVSERQLNYWMTVQKYRDGKPFEDPFRVAGEMIFEKDYRVRLNMSSPQTGYLYILNEGPSADESLSILFPSSTANSGSALITKDQQIQIPEDSWFAFDAQQGTEKLWLVFSPTAVSELEAVKGFANKQDKGVIANPDLSKAAKAFIETNSNPRPSAEKSEDHKETSVRASGNVIVHLINLEHH